MLNKLIDKTHQDKFTKKLLHFENKLKEINQKIEIEEMKQR